jgi:hypothetical protein
MKKLLLLACLMSAGIFSYSQVIVPKGKKILGGSFSGSTFNLHPDSVAGSPTADQNGSHVSFSPSFGYAIKENVVIGVSFQTDYGRWQTDYSGSGSRYVSSSFSMGPGFFYERFWKLGKGFHISGTALLNASFGKQKSTEYQPSGQTYKASGTLRSVNFSVTPNIGYSFNDKWMVQASLGEILQMGYSRSTWENTNPAQPVKTAYNRFAINTKLNRGLSLSQLGVSARFTF